MVLEQPRMTGHREHAVDSEVVFGKDAVAELTPPAEVQVALRDPAIGLGQAHFSVVEQDVEQGPFGIGLTQFRQVRSSHPASQPVPTGQVQAHLRPREDPWDRPQLFELLRGSSSCRTRAEPHAAELIDRADTAEPPLETLAVSYAAISGAGRVIDAIPQLTKPTLRSLCHRVDVGQRSYQHRGGDL